MALRCYGFARTGEDAAYLASDIPLEQVEQGLAALKTLGVGGFNVTMPCRTAVAGLVDELPPAARLIGACNTVTVSQDGRLTGHNTDGIGFVRNLHENGPVGVMTDYEAKFHELGQPINRCVGTMVDWEEPEVPEDAEPAEETVEE